MMIKMRKPRKIMSMCTKKKKKKKSKIPLRERVKIFLKGWKSKLFELIIV